MKITRKQIRRLIREEKRKLTENIDGRPTPEPAELVTILSKVALYFIGGRGLKGQSQAGAEIYDELMVTLDGLGLSTDVDNMLEELSRTPLK